MHNSVQVYVTDAFTLYNYYSDLARCHPLLLDHTDSELREQYQNPVQMQSMWFNTLDIEQAYRVSHAIRAHESCMHVYIGFCTPVHSLHYEA